MRCKVGDLVRFVGNPRGRPNIHGWIGRVVRFDPSRAGLDAWRVQPPLPGDVVWEGGQSYLPDWVLDSALSPLRDPGDDAKDEMLLPLPQEVTA